MSGENISVLNGLRGVAALIVVVSHFSNETNLFGGLLGWGGGQTGVMLFFILAGFLMTYLHINEPFSVRCVGTYALKRFARIYPLFVLVAALPGFLGFVEFPAAIAMGDVNTLAKYIGQITLVDPGINVFWTIRVEVLFYVCFVGLWALHALVNRSAFTLALVLGAMFGLGLYGFTFDFLFLSVVHYFLAGVASALSLRVFGKQTYRNAGLSFISVLLLLSMPLTFPKVFFELFGVEIVSWKSLLVLFQVVLLFNLAIRDGRYLERLLSCRPLVWVGKISYSVYLLHYFILLTMTSWFTPSENYAVSFVFFIAVVLVVSAFSYRYIEMPLQRFVLGLSSLFVPKLPK